MAMQLTYVYLRVYACIQRGSKCEHSRGHKHMWVCTTWVHVGECRYILVSACLYTNSFKVCTGRINTYVILHLGILTQKYLAYDICILLDVNIFIYIHLLVCIQRGSRCEGSLKLGFLYKRCDSVIHVRL